MAKKEKVQASSEAVQKGGGLCVRRIELPRKYKLLPGCLFREFFEWGFERFAEERNGHQVRTVIREPRSLKIT